MTMQHICDQCNEVYDSEPRLKNHKRNYHTKTTRVQYNDLKGETIVLVLERNTHDGKFSCPSCNRSWQTTNGARSHFGRFGGNCGTVDVGTTSSDDDDNADDVVNTVISMPPTLASLPDADANKCPRRSFDEAVLSACRQSAATDEEKGKTLWIMDNLKLQPFSMIDTNNVEQVALTHHDNLASIIKRDHGDIVHLHPVVMCGKRKWESVANSNNTNNTNNDMEFSLLSLIHYGPYSNQLSKRLFVELNDDACGMLNDAWTFLPQLRYACSQLLAGSIIINHRKEAVIVNTVEIYGRSRTMDVHRERFVNKKGLPSPSSLPPVSTKYPDTWATAMNDSEGKKLVIGTKTLNALVTSSLRIDASHTASVGGTIINFELDNSSPLTTAIFLDADSIRKANILAKDQRTDKIDRFDFFYQLRQLRSKFQHSSTYTLCRSSSVFTNDHRSRPYTIFSYADFDSGEQDSSAKISSQLLRDVALSMMASKNDPLVLKHLVHNYWSKCPDGQVKSVLNEIIQLHAEEGIKILDNKLLNQKLQDLANILSSYIAVANKSVAQNIQASFQYKM